MPAGHGPVRWRREWPDRLTKTAGRWAERGSLRCAQCRREGVARCRHWADEGSHRPGELAPPSWFTIGMRFGILWYLATTGPLQAGYWLAGRSCRILAWALYGVLTPLAAVQVSGERIRHSPR